jgi:hypothetical protein
MGNKRLKAGEIEIKLAGMSSHRDTVGMRKFCGKAHTVIKSATIRQYQGRRRRGKDQKSQ